MDTRRYELKLQQDSFWRERIFGFRELSEEKIRKRMECLNLHLEGPGYCVILFAPYLMEKEAGEIDRILLKLQNSIRDSYKKAGLPCYTITDTYCNVVSILSIGSGEEYRKLNMLTQRIAGDLIRNHEVKMYVGIGEPVDQISRLNRSKDTASEALAHKFNFSDGCVITAKDVKRYYHQTEVELKMHYDWILGCFYDGNQELLEVRLRNLFSAVQSTADDPLNRIRNVCIELTATLIRVARDMGVSDSAEMNSVYTYIAQMGTIAEIGEWFLGYSCGMMQRVGELRKDKTQQIIEQAEQFIENNLSDPELSLQAVSNHVDLSAPYFSSIFYRTKGIHISEYINRIRVKQAQKCLLETTDKAAAIAVKLGFSSPSYFNSVFKRYTGTTPSRFRERR
jgi:two-component system response regulator YesN